MAGGQVQTWPDPQLAVGPYRILPRTDGRWVVFDDRQPVGFMAAAIRDEQQDAVDAAEELVALGSPPRIAVEPKAPRLAAPRAPAGARQKPKPKAKIRGQGQRR